jgi:hypothetical protein
MTTLIHNVTELQNMVLAGSYELANDIDCIGFDFLSIGDMASPFTGSLDGKTYKISNLSQAAVGGIGLIGATSNTAHLKNIRLVNVSVNQPGYTSGASGLCSNNAGLIENCYTDGNVQGYQVVGGLVAENSGSILNCYSRCSVTSSHPFCAGGLCAWNDAGGSIDKCYSTGAVTISSGTVGGLCGFNAGAITNSYWDTETSGQAVSDGGIGKTTVQMTSQATFTGWDFTSIWAISPVYNSGYPNLNKVTPAPAYSHGPSKSLSRRRL